MDKEQYLQKLENCLKKYLTKAEITDILSDYGEFFEEGRRQNKSDIEISAKLGSPEIIAQQFIEESGIDKGAKFAEDMDEIKEKTAKGFDAAAKGIGNIASNIKEKTKNFHGISWLDKFIKWVFSATYKVCKVVFVVLASAILLFLLAAFLIFIVTSIIGLFTIGIAGLIVSAVIVGLLSPFITAVGICASLFSLAFAGLLLLLLIFITMQCIKGLKSLLKTTKETEEKYIGVEVSDNV